ncbi:MAG: hypothetical protein EXS30_02600 [Pedosphaera sp.]|nr:hypothetical protein [Pedosphaera sp.]
MVSLDALNTQDQTARAIVMEGGGDYLPTVKGNQPTVLQNIKTLVPAPEAPTPTQCRTDEEVGLLTSAQLDKLPAPLWLK